ncbi:unnamed protein product [Alternaria burnsii]|nr:unnamed protein product [Alternaria burnsii]
MEENKDFETKDVTFSAKALEMTMMETPPFSEREKIDEVLKKPRYLVMKHNKTRTLWQAGESYVSHEDTREMLDISQTAPYLHLLVTTSTDLRTLVRTGYNAKEWLAFVSQTHIPVFPWEHATYQFIRQALRSCGIRPKGALAGLVRTKKWSDDFARERGMNFCPLPFDEFYIDDIDLAAKWFHLTPIPHPMIAEDFNDKVVSAHGILEEARAYPKVDTEVLIKNNIYAKATMGRRDHMCQALLNSTMKGFEMGWTDCLKHLSLLDWNEKDRKAATTQLKYAPLPPDYAPHSPLPAEDVDRDYAQIHDPYHMIRLLQGFAFTEIEHLLSLRANAAPFRQTLQNVFRIEARESCDKPLQL